MLLCVAIHAALCDDNNYDNYNNNVILLITTRRGSMRYILQLMCYMLFANALIYRNVNTGRSEVS